MIRITFITLLALLSLPAMAIGIDATPGTLAYKLGASAIDTEALAVRGSIDASDLKFISSSMPGLRELDLSGCTISGASIPSGTFAGCGIQKITFPATALSIGDMAFAASALESVEIPRGSTVGLGAFASCPNLKSIRLNGADISQGYTFNNCTALQTVEAGSCTEIGTGAFMGCSSLYDFSFPAELSSIGHSAFAGSGLECVNLASCTKLKLLDAWCFAETPVASAALPDGVRLGEGVFFGCSALTDIALPKGIRELPDFAMTGASAVGASLSIAEGTDHIGAFSLKGLTSVEKLNLPSTLSYIGDNAMEGMTGLSVIDASAMESVPELGEDIWLGVNQDAVQLEVAEAMEDAFKSTEQWQDFEVIKSDKGLVELPTAEECAIRGRITGSELVVQSTGGDISMIELYDLAGRLLTNETPYASEARIDLSAYDAKIIIVRATLRNGIKAGLKMTR